MTTRLLDRILASKRAELEGLLAAAPPLRRRQPAPGLLDALARPPSQPLRLIAEIKHRSPSAGELSRALTPSARALRYARAGAAMISVLTDGPFFGGSFEDLAEARDALDAELGERRPYLMCKEFVLHAVQIERARDAGADAVLLIVRCLEGRALRDLVRAAWDRGMEPLVEVASEGDLARARAAGARMIGVNARDLDTLRMDAGRAASLLSQLDPAVVAVHLSGLRGPSDVARVAASRADAALIGEALMRREDPEALLLAMSSVR